MKKIVTIIVVLTLLGGGAIGFVNTVNYIGRIETDKVNLETKLNQANNSLTAARNIKAEDILAEVNKLRVEKGLSPVEIDDKLNESARNKAYDMMIGDYYDHKNPITGKVGTYYIFDIPGQRCRSGGENLLMFSTTYETKAKDLVNSWKESKSHYEAMIDPKSTKIGVWNIPTIHNGWVYLYSVMHFCEPY